MIKKGDGVIYMLTGTDALAINRRRTNGPSIAARMKQDYQVGPRWPAGAQAHIGNTLREGQTFPGVVVEDWADRAGSVEAKPNLQVWLDGTDTLWVTSVMEGDGPGMYRRQH